MNKLAIQILLFLIFASTCFAASDEQKTNLVDCEIHYLDFNQTTDGMDALFREMDKAGIDVACIMGVPLQKIWSSNAESRPRTYESDDEKVYYYSATDVLLARAILDLPLERRERLKPLLCGFNPVDRNAVNHVRRMLDLYPGFWSGIGEILTRHDTLTHLSHGEPPRADHPALMEVYKLAAERNLTVLLHSNITSTREAGLIYLRELKSALAANPKTRFVWAHAGISANIARRQHIKNLHLVIGELLNQYPNLWIGLSWTLSSDYLIDDDDRPSLEWIDLVTRNKTRFLIGSDVVGRFRKLDKALKEERIFINALPENVAARVSRANALALFPARDAS